MNETNPPLSKLVVVMVGLPARGKTYIARKVSRYLNWLGHRSRIFNVGNYRRQMVGANQPSEFFDPDNIVFTKQRTELADLAMQDMLAWLQRGGDDGSVEGSLLLSMGDLTERGTISRSSSITTPASSGAGVGGPSCIALYDATNSTKERREMILNQCQNEGIKVMFIESICDDQQIILNNIKEVKLTSPDYKDCEEEAAIRDFQRRILQYEKSYETLSIEEGQGKISFVKLSNVGSQVIVNNVRGYLQSRIVYFLMNLNITPRSFFISRHGESMFNVDQRIGGDSSLSPRGMAFASKLPGILKDKVDPQNTLTIWTSTLKRTIQTASQTPYQKLQWKQLDELDSGVCDGLTYEEIEAQYPLDFVERDNDKFNYRYHGGESYRDLVHRLEPVILELERHHEPDRLIYICAHQAVVRAIYAYFHNISHENLPYIKVLLLT